MQIGLAGIFLSKIGFKDWRKWCRKLDFLLLHTVLDFLGIMYVKFCLDFRELIIATLRLHTF